MQRSKNDIWVGLFVLLGAVAVLFLALKAANLLTWSFSQDYEVTATPNTTLLMMPLPTSLNTSTPPCIWLQNEPASTPMSNTPTT